MNSGQKLAPRLTKIPRSECWQIYVPGAHGQPAFYKSTRTTDEAEAKRILADSKITELSHAAQADSLTKHFFTRLVVGRGVTTAKARDEFSTNLGVLGWATPTIIAYVGTVDRWIRHSRLGQSPIGAARDTHISTFVNQPETGKKLKSYEADLKHLNAFFEFCRKNNWVPVNPCRNVAVRTDGMTHDQLVSAKRPTFTDEEIARLLAFIPRDDFWHGAVLLGRDFAPRISSVAQLEWASLPDLKRVRLFARKNRVVVDEPITPDLAAWLAEWPRLGESGYVFPEQAARAVDNSLNRLSEQFAAILVRVGISGKSFQCFRHTKVTKEFDAILAKLGGEQQAVLAALIAQHGMAGLQKLIGHVAGSAVTGAVYYNPAISPRP